jgi:uncharacterized protein (UPF0212 family)
LLQPLAVVCLDPHCGMQAEPVDVSAQRAFIDLAIELSVHCSERRRARR